MKANRLIRFLAQRHPLPTEFVKVVETSIKPVIYPKGHYLVQAQAAASHLHFVESGFAVAFRYEHKKKIVTDFWQAGEMILSPGSFFDQVPTDEIIELAVESRIHSISHRTFNELTQRFPFVSTLVLGLIVHYAGKCERRLLDLHILDTWERYGKLLRTYPRIEMKVSQETIAAYLNVTPPSLSRMKALRH